MDAGYFPSTFFAHEYFPVGPQYFPEYGTATTEVPVPAKLGMRRRVRRKPTKRDLFDDMEFVSLLTQFIELD